jgi:hypothetical protein
MGYWNGFDYADPSTDPAYCDNHSEPPPDFDCAWCSNISQDETFWPFCSASCAAEAEGDSPEDEPDPRERDEDDGRTFADPRDEREDRLDRD